MAHGFQMLRHTRLLHEMRVYFQNLKFQYVKNYPQISRKKKVSNSRKSPKVIQSNSTKAIWSHPIAKRMANARPLRSLSGSSWHSEHFLTSVLQCVYIMTYTMYNIVIATHATLQHLPCPALLSKFRCQGTGHDRLLGRNNHGHGKGNQVYGD